MTPSLGSAPGDDRSPATGVAASGKIALLLKSPATTRQKLIVGLCVALVSAFFLFFNLGHYALWDDEAETALGALGVLETGDTTAVLGHNIQARRGGINLINLHDRVTPPLPTYLMAASFKLFGVSSLAARLPFALCGFLTVILLLRWMWQTDGSLQTWLLTALAITGNVSFFLYFRQARYYGAALFLGVLLVYLYLNWRATRPHAFLFSLVAGLLFMCQPIFFAQAAAVIGLDFLLFNRREKIFSPNTLFFLALPVCILVAGTLTTWNPLASRARSYMEAVTISDRFTMLGWYVRDLNASELLVGGLVLLSPLAFLRSKNVWIARSLFSLVVVTVMTSIISYQNVHVTSLADIRYAIAVIPLGFVIGVLTVRDLFSEHPWVGLGVAVVAFWTNFLHIGITAPAKLHSTPLRFVQELSSPVSEPYTPASEWIKAHVPLGASVWVLPDYMAYPLMFYAPHAIYAWQIENRSDPQFACLPKIHFRGEEMPDYIIAFGPVVQNLHPVFDTLRDRGVNYNIEAKLPAFWKDLYRPELFWRSFATINHFDENLEGITVFHKCEGRTVSPAPTILPHGPTAP